MKRLPFMGGRSKARMIVAENISKNFNGKTAVKNISFEVKEGETMVLLGTSGCGKTTTLRMLNRLEEPTEGAIRINGQPIFSQPVETLRKKIGYVLQNHGLFPHYTIGENIAVVPQLLKWSKEKIRQRISSLLEKLQLPQELINAYPSALSGGQQQRVGLARALAADPPIMLMDEPFGALDPITRAGIRNEFRALDELRRKTIVLVTHDVQEAFELGDRICLMDKGEIKQAGKPAELLFNPRNDFVRSFFDQQRLQLELRSLTVKDIWQELPEVLNKQGDIVENNQSLWQLMNALSTKQVLVVRHPDDQTLKQVDFSAIQSALLQFRKRFPHG